MAFPKKERLQNIWTKGQKKALQELIKPFKEELDAHTVARLRGKEYGGKVPEISELVEYLELVFQTSKN